MTATASDPTTLIVLSLPRPNSKVVQRCCSLPVWCGGLRACAARGRWPRATRAARASSSTGGTWAHAMPACPEVSRPIRRRARATHGHGRQIFLAPPTIPYVVRAGGGSRPCRRRRRPRDTPRRAHAACVPRSRRTPHPHALATSYLSGEMRCTLQRYSARRPY
jgi:hypothetical protein